MYIFVFFLIIGTRVVPEFYAPKAVPISMEPLITACISGDIDKVHQLWRPTLMRPLIASFGRDDTCHPLLHAAHRLHVDIVKFLLDEGISPRIRGTVHPYTGDCMTVAELQGMFFNKKMIAPSIKLFGSQRFFSY